MRRLHMPILGRMIDKNGALSILKCTEIHRPAQMARRVPGKEEIT